MKRVVTFLSDFGSNSPYPAAMKAVAASLTNARFVDITHDIKPHNVLEGAFVLWSVARYFPEGTIHCAVVDPGVGTERRGLILSTGKQMFVGPDNGLLVPAANAQGILHAFEITNPSYFLAAPSSTFHGRDIFAPIAAQLTQGVPTRKIGSYISEWVVPELDFQGGTYDESQRAFQGEVIYLDHFGNAITNIPGQLIRERVSFRQELRLKTGSRESQVLLRESYGFAGRRELCLLVGSHDLLEIAVREGSAEKRLKLQVGDPVTLHCHEAERANRS